MACVRDVLRYLDGKWIPPKEEWKGKGEREESGPGGDDLERRSGGSSSGAIGRRLPPHRGRARSASSTRSRDHHNHHNHHGRRTGAHIYKFQNDELIYTGRRPPFITVFPPPYEVPPWKSRPMGHAYSKEDAERLAGAVSDGARGNTELHWAAGRGDALRVAELLMMRSREDPVGAVAATQATAPAALDSRNAAGETPLHHAAQCVGASSVAVMELLLAEGADSNAADHQGTTPLMRIFTAGCWLPEGDLRCKVLIRAGARVDVSDSAGETLLHKAIIYNVCREHPSHKRPPTAHRSPCRIRQPSSPNLPNRQHHRGRSGGAAAITSHGPSTTTLAELIQLLLLLQSRERLPPYPDDAEYDDASRRRADRVAAIHRSGTTKTGMEPVSHGLALAAGAESSGSFVASVVAAAAAAATATGRHRGVGGVGSAVPMINARDARGRTALHVACSRPHLHGPGMEDCCVTVLLREGADPNIADDAGQRPLHLVLAEAAAATRLHDANLINHTKLGTATPKQP
ncbi:hypothetical protein Vretifemale_13554, partial [Volvox reticuliferus]